MKKPGKKTVLILTGIAAPVAAPPLSSPGWPAAARQGSSGRKPARPQPRKMKEVLPT